MKSLKLTGRLIFPGFHFVTGITMLVIMVISNAALIHIGLLGILSIIVSYGLGKVRRWALYLLIVLLFSGLTFGLTTIYSSARLLDQDLATLSFQATIGIYLVLLVISFVDAFSKRGKFE